MEINTLLLLLVLLLLLALLVLSFKKSNSGDEASIFKSMLNDLHSGLGKIENSVKEDFKNNRLEINQSAKTNREELNQAIHQFRNETADALRQISKDNTETLEKLNFTLNQRLLALIEQTEQNFQKFSEANLTQLEKMEQLVTANLKNMAEQAKTDNNLMRDVMIKSIKDFQEAFDKNVQSFNELQREKFGRLETLQQELVQGTEKKLETIRVTVEEKLEKTLSERLGQSFETVGKQLIEVQKGLGEMQSIAADVGGLKKVLNNVKLRGGVGEIQLAMILEQILAPSQYAANVKTKFGSNEAVEFAIKLPGKSEDEKNFVYLPIDAKFPKDTYEHLLNAYEKGSADEIETASKNLELTIKKMAKDIRDKYVDPPNTTDFAILFVPFESIYAEVIRRSALVDQLRDEFKITIAGPTTLVALLNSLQMGFRTLALQKRSSEVWKVLSTVKVEFEKFGSLLEKAQKNIQTGLGQLDDVVGVRTKAIQRRLREVQTLPESSQNQLPHLPYQEEDNELD